MNPEPIPIVTTAELIGLLTLGGLLIATAYTELKDNRIPNVIPLIGLTVGLLVGYFPGGPTLGQSIVGFLAGFGFLFVFYMFGGMGGGDVKLMGAVGALVGYPAILTVLMFTALIGGLMAIVVLIWNRQALKQVARSLNPFRRRKGEAAAEEGAEPPPAPTIPYGLAIVGGCLATFFLGT